MPQRVDVGHCWLAIHLTGLFGHSTLRSMPRSFDLCVAAALLATTAVSAFAEQTATELVRAATLGQLASSEHDRFKMTLTPQGGNPRVRQVEFFLEKSEAGHHKSLMRFTGPNAMKGLALLTHQEPEGDDDQWIYLPAFKMVRRIVSRTRTSRFAGSDLTYEDLRQENLKLYSYAYLEGTEEILGITCKKVEAVPTDKKTKEETGYSKRVLFIDPEKRRTIRVFYYNKQGQRFKIMINSEFREEGKLWRPYKTQIVDLTRKHRTVLEFSKLDLTAKLAPGTFTVWRLRQGH